MYGGIVGSIGFLEVTNLVILKLLHSVEQQREKRKL